MSIKEPLTSDQKKTLQRDVLAGIHQMKIEKISKNKKDKNKCLSIPLDTLLKHSTSAYLNILPALPMYLGP